MLSKFGLSTCRNRQIPTKQRSLTMERGTIDLREYSGGVDLAKTLESGQTYLWERLDGQPYGAAASGCWFETAFDDIAIRLRQREGRLDWIANRDATDTVCRLLRLDDDLESMYEAMPADTVIRHSIEHGRGMRLVRDPIFPCLISFICSTQMRVGRIHGMQRALTAAFGDEISLGDEVVQAYPRPERIAQSTEEALRDLGLGYRAPYVLETSRMVAEGTHPNAVADLPYEEARTWLTRYPGVGNKVADCVLLFSLGYLEAVPLDTWIRKAIEHEFPGCDAGSYAETSRAIRARLGGAHAGYTQTYLFHYLRTNGVSSNS